MLSAVRELCGSTSAPLVQEPPHALHDSTTPVPPVVHALDDVLAWRQVTVVAHAAQRLLAASAHVRGRDDVLVLLAAHASETRITVADVLVGAAVLARAVLGVARVRIAVVEVRAGQS